ncbi:phage integrase SAM-like domain-containing protein [Flavobacterium sp. GT3R68]|uniref:phage integrase SAM-like domain-containing protein n=1 Tax=Flavobacterium sp. GT3R68 TaxID=2594437 RepID=UPI000F87704E|nr:phage integrase SAM-like domain-containing protein [Flavobacterium sp. GT3R68]RTY89633.1 integrase [Flavobacterium sp. GSN2]TRW89480.1 integrase [Flavobacterium sp. GT3R68]
MATIQFKALGTKDPVNLNIRFFHNKINCYAKSNVFINSINWSNKTYKVKGLPLEEKKAIEEKIENISKHILQGFNTDFPTGETIDSNWLIKQVDGFYCKPEGDDDYRFYFVPFVAKYIESSKTRINPKSGMQISVRTIQNYTTTLTRLKEFEIKHEKLKTKNINLNFHGKFTSFLKTEGNYSSTVIEKYISHIKNFVKESKIEGFETSVEIESNKFTFKRDETLDTYLDENEIETIFNLDLSNNLRLENVRDLFIVGVWSGLRISDLKRINDFNISNNRIKIICTEKTQASVEIPIHPQLKRILEKRNNVLPIISEQKFNLYVKDLCEAAGIDETILGSIKDPKTNRKVKGYYPKYKLISSHTCRRSFVSNHYGKLPDKTIMAITSHRSNSQFLKYVKTTLKEQANKLEEYWSKKEELKSIELMKVV